MPKTLIQRFTHGNFVDLPTFSAEADFFVGDPVRQRELIALTETQIELARKATTALRDSTSEVASVIREELDRQTAAISDVVRQGADRVVSAVDDLADRVSAELVDVRWQLVQLGSTSEQVLQVLKRPLSTEAQDYLRQGIRNLVNDKLEPAEERFLKALELDNTDYQILMNLAAVGLRKGNAQQVTAYLQDALTLPANLDKSARAEALWYLARLHYAEFNYRSAASIAKESLALVSRPRRVFQYGVYLVLAGDAGQGFSMVESAIRSDPRLFGLAAISSDLVTSGDSLEGLLSSLARESIAKLRAQYDELLLQAPALISLPFIDNEAVSEAFARQMEGLARVLIQSAYTELQTALAHASELRHVLPRYTRLSNAEGELRVMAEQNRLATSRLAAAEKALGISSNVTIYAILGVLGALVGVFFATIVSAEVFRSEIISDGFLCMGLFGIPLFVIVWIVSHKRRGTLLEGEAKEAGEVADTTKALLASATSQRDLAASVATIPTWPLTDRWSVRSDTTEIVRHVR